MPISIYMAWLGLGKLKSLYRFTDLPIYQTVGDSLNLREREVIKASNPNESRIVGAGSGTAAEADQLFTLISKSESR